MARFLFLLRLPLSFPLLVVWLISGALLKGGEGGLAFSNLHLI